LLERAQIIDPVVENGLFTYTTRDREERLVRVEVSLDGSSSRCTVDPPVVAGEVPHAAPPPLLAPGVVAGDRQSCVTSGSGESWCWGYGFAAWSERVGRALPDRLMVHGAQVAVGDGFACAAGEAGWGSCSGPEQALGHSFAPLLEGTKAPFVAWGRVLAATSKGVLRVFPSTSEVAVPAGLAPIQNPRSVALARDRACAVLADGAVRCWGATAPSFGGLGDARRVALGEDLACVIRSDGSTWCVRAGALPTMIPDVIGASSLDVGESHACAVDGAGSVWCWGENQHGQLGDGSVEARARPVRVWTNAISVATGAGHTCAVSREGRVACWGANESGQLGDGTYEERHVPTGVVW